MPCLCGTEHWRGLRFGSLVRPYHRDRFDVERRREHLEHHERARPVAEPWQTAPANWNEDVKETEPYLNRG